MASDEELARRVAQVERDSAAGRSVGTLTTEELDEYRSVAGEIHDELARRIATVEENTADDAELAAVVDRLDRIEARIEELESRL